MSDFEKNLDARLSRRLKAEDRYLSRLERREAAAERLVGELCRDGVVVWYIHQLTAKGLPTGRVVEFPGLRGHGEAIAYLLRNNYV